MASKQQKEKQIYQGIEVDSQEEIMAAMWFYELQIAGYVKEIRRAESLQLSNAVELEFFKTVQMKTKSKTVLKKDSILKGHLYTAEFLIVWTAKAKENIVWVRAEHTNDRKNRPFIGHWDSTDGLVSYIEVKPVWDQQNMERLFKINQKWVMDKYGIFINLVKPQELFAKTFTPEAYRLTATGKDKKIKWQVRSIDEWIKQKEDEVRNT